MVMNKRIILFTFFLPIIFGLIIGRVSFIFDKEIIISALITISDNIIIILKFITPWLVLCLTATAIADISGKTLDKIKILLNLFKVLFYTLIPLMITVLIISLLLLSNLDFNLTSDESISLDPLIQLPLYPMFSTFLGILIGFILGLFLNHNHQIFVIIKKIIDLMLKWIYIFFNKILRPIMPIWILASFSFTAYIGSGATFFLTDFLLSILIVVLHFGWLAIMYFITSKKINCSFKKICLKGFEIYGYVVSLWGQGGGIILPFIIEREKELDMDEKKATFVTATSFNMPGSLIANIVIILGVSYMTNLELSIFIMFKLFFVIVFLTILAPSIPGGTASIVSGILPNYGFSSSMISLYQAMYYKMGTPNAATNNASDLYITPFV